MFIATNAHTYARSNWHQHGDPNLGPQGKAMPPANGIREGRILYMSRSVKRKRKVAIGNDAS